MRINFFNTLGSKKFIFCISISITGRCNASCSYCRFYAEKKRSNIWYDISDELFDIYCLFICQVKKILPSSFKIQCRFTGGEPLLLGERLFSLAEKIYKTSGIKPYVLTNGKALDERFVKLARKSKLSHLYVSIENPLNPDKGAPNPIEIIHKIRKYNSSKFPILPGVVVINNEDFKNLYKICKFFYRKLKCLPTISEISFHYFTPPTPKQLKELRENIYKIVRDFRSKTPIRLFPDISPELCLGEDIYYIFPLDIENQFHLTLKNINNNRVLSLISDYMKKCYVDVTKYCKNRNCDWYEECKQVRWIWTETYGKIPLTEKIKSFCIMKKTINSAVLKALKL